MNILAIDTSSEACSAALNLSGTIINRFEIAPQKHSQLILPMCDSLMKDAGLEMADLDAVAFGQGPGSFTGLRIAAGVAQGIAFGADIPVIGVSTLAALARQIDTLHKNAIIHCSIDARMKEVYWANFSIDKKQNAVLVEEERVSKPQEIVFEPGQSYVGIGSGWQMYGDILAQQSIDSNIEKIYADALPAAKEIAEIAAIKFQNNETGSAETALPVYLRNNVAKKSQKIQNNV